MILLIDNYDSFTWNLVQRIGELDPRFEVRVVRNDEIDAARAVSMDASHLIVSPGPCTPEESGNSREIIAALAGRVPVLGVCLGHQCIGQMHGMCVERAPLAVHGKTSMVHHDGRSIFAGLSQPFEATRYHSLIVRLDSVPAEGWEVSAWTDEVVGNQADGRSGTRRIVQGLRRVWSAAERSAGRVAPLEGVQFHPESFLTIEGPRILANFLGIAADRVVETGGGPGVDSCMGIGGNSVGTQDQPASGVA